MLLLISHFVRKDSLLMLTCPDDQYLYYCSERVGSLLFTQGCVSENGYHIGVSGVPRNGNS